MKAFLHIFAFAIFFIGNIAIAQDCPSESELSFFTQTQIDQFIIDYPNCTELNSSIRLYSTDNDSPKINNLNGFSNIEVINGDLSVVHIQQLSNLSGLESLIAINGDLNLFGGGFTSFSGIENLEVIQGILSASSGINVADFTDFESLMSLGELNIMWTNMQSVEGLENITEINNVEITSNSNMQSLDGFDNLSTVNGDFLISVQDNINSLSNLVYVGGNLALGGRGVSSLSPVDNIQHIGGSLDIYNPAYTEIAPLTNLTYLGGLSIDCNYTDSPCINSVSGISHLEALHGDLSLSDTDLVNLEELSNLNLIEGQVYLYGNQQLSDISGLNNVDPNSVIGEYADLSINENPLLSNCATPLVCGIITLPVRDVEIASNLGDCATEPQVYDACARLSTNNLDAQDALNVVLDGFKTNLYVKGTQVKSVNIFNALGALVKTSKEDIIPIQELKSGVYFIQVTDVNGEVYQRKIVK